METEPYKLKALGPMSFDMKSTDVILEWPVTTESFGVG